MRQVLNVFICAVFGELRRRARELLELSSAQCGAVTFVQRCNDALQTLRIFTALSSMEFIRSGLT